MPLLHSEQDHHVNTTGYSLREYLELVDWAGRQIKEDKRGAIAEDVPPLLERLGLNDRGFLDFVGGDKANAVKPRVIGSISRIQQAAEKISQKFLNGMGLAKGLYLASR